MLVRRGVKDDLGPILGKDTVDLGGIPHTGDEGDKVKLRELTAQLLLNIVGVVLIDIENDEAARAVRGDLTAKLRADRAAAARHKDGALFSSVIFHR